MERIMSIEEKIRRAEERYQKKLNANTESKRTQRIPANTQKKDIKLLKKMIIQIIICILIYIVIYTIQNSKTIFSENIINKAKEILSYDTNFPEIYENIKNSIITFKNDINDQTDKEEKQNNEQQTQEKQNEEEIQNTNEEQLQEEAIGGAQEENNEGEPQLSQEEQDIQNAKNTTTYIKPIEGTITSPYGYRGNATGAVPKNHTGTDIATTLGTKIKSATEGEVVLVSEEGDYGKHIKIQIGEVSIIYAHCNAIYVSQGQHVIQGQEIAEVGSTGNSTGPHLHFEIRFLEKTIDPQTILEL